MVGETRTFLSATCKDLLWIPKEKSLDSLDPHQQSGQKVQIQFLHRTVYDFLSTDRMQALLETVVPAHFCDRRILYLLNLARLKFNMPLPFMSSKLFFFHNTANMSLGEAHAALCNEFVSEFEKVALWYEGLSQTRRMDLVEDWCWISEPKALVTFAAFHRNRYILTALDAMTKTSIDSVSQPSSSDLIDVLMAALGECPKNRFSLDEVDLVLAEELIGSERVDLNCKVEGQCSGNIWQLFLRKYALWLNSLSVREEHQNSSQGPISIQLRHAWEVAKIFLARWVSIEEEFCINPSDSKRRDHVHVKETALDFLTQHIPLEWRLECADGRLSGTL